MTSYMDPTPASNNEVVEFITECSPGEVQQRLSACQGCPNFLIDTDNHTKCKGTGCNISLMTTYKFKMCPLEKW
jgi:hypothetical protein